MTTTDIFFILSVATKTLLLQETQRGSGKNDKKGLVTNDAFSNLGDNDL
jgi:hypothetical protein